MTVVNSFFNIFTIVSVLVYALGIASLIMITVSLIQSARAQRSIARTLERIEKHLQNRP
jgi:low affinity Fe/Cu permease